MPDSTSRRAGEFPAIPTHYAWCRNLGQLQAVEVFQIRRSGFETFVAHETGRGRRLGEIKASPLSRETGWSKRFNGAIGCGKNGE